jgi:hypothetical protein
LEQSKKIRSYYTSLVCKVNEGGRNEEQGGPEEEKKRAMRSVSKATAGGN